MANESVTDSKVDELFGKLAQGIEGLRDAARNTSEEAPPATEAEAARVLAAFAGYDSTVFAGWTEAVADLLACGRIDGLDRSTVPNIGSLIYSLTQAANELADVERAEMRARA